MSIAMSKGLRRASALLGIVLGAVLVSGAFSQVPDVQGVVRDRSIVAEARRIAKQPLFPPAGPRRTRVLIVGDSMLIPVPDAERRQRSVARALGPLLDTGPGADPGAKVRITPLVLPGLSISDHYALADVIVGSEPDVVVIELNLMGFRAQGAGGWSRSDFVGWIEPKRLPEALRLPLYGRSVTADQLLWRFALVRAGLDRPWARLVWEQGRLTGARRRLVQDVDAALGGLAHRTAFTAARVEFAKGLLSLPDRPRPSARAVESAYGAVLEGVDRDHPLLEVLAALVADYRAAGVVPVVYATPINVEHIASLGIDGRAGLSASMSATAHAVASAGGSFVDLHAWLPDAAFRDANGHLSVNGPDSGVERVARALREPLLAAIERARVER